MLLYGERALDIPMREIFSLHLSHSEDATAWNLPRSVTERLLLWLDERELLSLGSTCRVLHEFCKDAVVWMTLFARRFRYLPPFSPGVTKDGFNLSSGYWISRFAHQREEVSSFGSFHALPSTLVVPETHVVKMVLIGPSNVGKTSLINALKSTRAHHPQPVASYEPTMFVRTSVAYGFVGGAKGLYGLKIWDIPGEPRNRSVSSVYCNDTHCVVCVFDASRRESFLQLRDWILDVRLRITTSRQTKLVVIACKGDLEMPHDLEQEVRSFVRQERVAFLKLSTLSQAFEWKLFCWRLVADTLRVSFL